jgi:hypothetical protein
MPQLDDHGSVPAVRLVWSLATEVHGDAIPSWVHAAEQQLQQLVLLPRPAGRLERRLLRS